MKKNQKICIVITICLAILMISTITYISIQYSKGIEFTQLSPQGYRQMMGYVVKEKDNLIVVDGGTEQDSENLKKYIDKYTNGVIDYWFITHAHDDHIGAMVTLLEQESVKIENIICSLNELEWYKEKEPERADIVARLYNLLESHNNIKDVKLEEKFNIGDVEIEILGIRNPEITENVGNNQSMVFKMYINNKDILFLGDAGEEISEKLIESNGNKLKSYVVQMAHHGQAGVTEKVYESINPKICFWSTPEWLWDNNLNNQGYNTGTWKTLETREWIEKLDVNTNYVAKDGDITIRIW